MFTEREAIKKLFEQIPREKRALQDETEFLLYRLRRLDQRENEVENSGSLTGKFSEREGIKLRLEQIENESKSLNEQYEHLFRRLRQLDERENTNPIDVLISQSAKHPLTTNKPLVADSPTNESIVPSYTKRIQLSSKVDNDNTSIRKRVELTENTTGKVSNANKMTSSQRQIGQIILTLLKDNKEPMKAYEIRKYLEKNYNFKHSNFSEYMSNVVNKYPAITKVGKGLYQFILPPPISQKEDEGESEEHNRENNQVEKTPTNDAISQVVNLNMSQISEIAPFVEKELKEYGEAIDPKLLRNILRTKYGIRRQSFNGFMKEIMDFNSTIFMYPNGLYSYIDPLIYSKKEDLKENIQNTEEDKKETVQN